MMLHYHLHFNIHYPGKKG